MLKKIISAPLLHTLALAALVLAAMLWRLPPLANLENGHFDFWAERFRAPEDQPIAIVAIDDKSLAHLGEWSWSRPQLTALVQKLSDDGARAMGICLLFHRPEVNPGLQEIQTLREELAAQSFKGGRRTEQVLERLLRRSESRLRHDDQLIAAIRHARNVVLPVRFTMVASTSVDESISGLLAINSLRTAGAPNRRPAAWMAEANALGLDGRRPILAAGVQATFADLAGKAGALGHLNLQADSDGRLRHVPLLIEFDGRLYPSLSLQLALKHIGVSTRDVSIGRNASGRPLLRAGHLQLALDPAYRMLIQHNAPWTRQRTYSLSEVLDGAIDPSAFKNRIVLIGLTAGGVAPGFRLGSHAGVTTVEVMAETLARILSSDRLTRPGWALVLEITALLYFAGLLAFVVPRVNLRIGLFIMAFFLAAWYGAGTALLSGYGFWIRPYGPLILTLAGFALIQVTAHARRRRQEKLEFCKTLGLSYQGQGMLDMAYEQYMQCSVRNATVKNLLYNLGLDFERKRMFNKAVAIYRHIQGKGAFKDVQQRIARLAALDDPLAATVAASMGEPTLQMDDSQAKPVFGRYEILSELGHGAMGTVFLGRDPKINRRVAIKTLAYADVDASELDEVKARFFREAEAAGRLSHPNIVSIYDAGEEHDMAYIAMELLKGEDLTHHRKPGHLLPQGRVLTIMADVTEALAYAHSQGVIHRDIKPGNIMLLKDGRVKVTDFGIARVVDSTATRTGIILGTPSYMSPEQVTDKPLDGRSDLFALGIVCYELLTGTKPFKGENISATMHAIVHTAHTPVKQVAGDIPDCLAVIVDRLLVKALSKRFRSADQALKAIEACRAEMV